jgi:hypothetical protein
MSDREMYQALRREFLTLQREKAEVEVALGRLRGEFRTAASLCSCGAYSHDESEPGADDL